jgi:EpsD family peptidyl-prolyl cis-trans isomerase
LALASCGDKGAPKGQVVAKVGKDEVTVLDLQSEMAGFQAPNAQVRKAAEQQALNAIVQRKILAELAKKEKIDKTPEFARQKERMDEVLLVRSWQEKLVKAVPPPSPEEVQKFVTEHPDLYSARKIIVVDGLRFPATQDPGLVQALQPLNTLEEVAAVLTQRKIPFGNGAGEIDTLRVDPRFAEQLLKLPPNEVFVAPQGNAVLVGHIREVKTVPVAANIATKHATEYLRNSRVREAVGRRFSSAIAAGQKEVKYNKGYEPPKPPAKGAPPA